MPNMPKSPKTPEDAIERAYNTYFDRGKPKVLPLAKEFGLNTTADYKRLLTRINSRSPRNARKGPNKILDNNQEYVLE
jgi:hypothetical protein